jgi:transglutaminase-like putative cysteine protease
LRDPTNLRPAIRRLLRVMRSQVRKSLTQKQTHIILRSILAQDSRALPAALWSSLRSRVRYHRESPHVVGTVSGLYGDPCKGGGVGDCNDYAMASAALGLAGRYEARWALGFDQDGDVVHVWTQLRPYPTPMDPDPEWIDVDPTPGAPPPGMGSPVDVPGAHVVGYFTSTV